MTDSKDWTGNKASVYKTLAASNHRPIREREKNKDCDFFVGVTNFQVITAHDVALKVLKFFEEKNNENTRRINSRLERRKA